MRKREKPVFGIEAQVIVIELDGTGIAVTDCRLVRGLEGDISRRSLRCEKKMDFR